MPFLLPCLTALVPSSGVAPSKAPKVPTPAPNLTSPIASSSRCNHSPSPPGDEHDDTNVRRPPIHPPTQHPPVTPRRVSQRAQEREAAREAAKPCLQTIAATRPCRHPKWYVNSYQPFLMHRHLTSYTRAVDWK